MEENQAKGEIGTASQGLTLKCVFVCVCVSVLHSMVGSWPYPQGTNALAHYEKS
jgi:hypothetical protein